MENQRPFLLGISFVLLRHGAHEPVPDHDRVFSDDWQFDVSAVAFTHDHGHLFAINRRLQHRPGVFVLAFDHIITTASLGHSGQRCLFARIGGLIPC